MGSVQLKGFRKYRKVWLQAMISSFPFSQTLFSKLAFQVEQLQLPDAGDDPPLVNLPVAEQKNVIINLPDINTDITI